MSSVNYSSANRVKIELPSSVLTDLIKSGLLHGSDCKCLDAHTKKVLWQSILLTSTSGDH